MDRFYSFVVGKMILLVSVAVVVVGTVGCVVVTIKDPNRQAVAHNNWSRFSSGSGSSSTANVAFSELQWEQMLNARLSQIESQIRQEYESEINRLQSVVLPDLEERVKQVDQQQQQRRLQLQQQRRLKHHHHHHQQQGNAIKREKDVVVEEDNSDALQIQEDQQNTTTTTTTTTTTHIKKDNKGKERKKKEKSHKHSELNNDNERQNLEDYKKKRKEERKKQKIHGSGKELEDKKENTSSSDPISSNTQSPSAFQSVFGTSEIDDDDFGGENGVFPGAPRFLLFADYEKLYKKFRKLSKALACVDMGLSSKSQLILDGCNVNIRNGNIQKATVGNLNGLGNLILGYNERNNCPPTTDQCARTGSHNIVVGTNNAYTSVGGIVAGSGNRISGMFATVTGGYSNVAAGITSHVSGGRGNIALAEDSVITGGEQNIASGIRSTAVGGLQNVVSGRSATILGGKQNSATGSNAVVVSGTGNRAGGLYSTVAAGAANLAGGAGALVASGTSNEARGPQSVVTGGNRGVATEFNQVKR